MANTAQLGAYGDLSGSGLMFRNKVVNGNMAIYQRQAPATSDTKYSLDRWLLIKTNDATESVAQSTDAPSGFAYSLRNTVSIGDATIGSTQFSGFNQPIEGYNIADLAFGTSSAKPVAVSFWIRSSVTGIYTANIANADSTRICPFNFTINTANTWEYKTVTLPGCTDGTWNTTTAVGLFFRVYSAIGSSYLGGTAGVWNSSAYYGSGTPVNAIASNGNIIAITGVQVESGSAPTPFEHLPFATQVILCQRYYEKTYNIDVAPGSNTNIGGLYQLGSSDSANNIGLNLAFKVIKRATPSAFLAYTITGADGWQYGRSGASATIPTASLTTSFLGASGGLVYGGVGAAWVPAWIAGHWVVSADFN